MKSNGLDVLLKTYWSSTGWKDGTISEEDFKMAKKEGYMFEYPKFEKHDMVLKKIKEVLLKIDDTDVANAFLFSLSTRKLEYRSILGSYYYAKSIPDHKIDDNLVHCDLCGWYAWRKKPKEKDIKQGINIFNFERYKFGGVRHTQMDYALFDLEQFLKLPKVVPSKNDEIILKKILGCIKKLDKNDKAGKLASLIMREKIFPCNQNEIHVLLGILGVSGILSSREFPSYEEVFVDEYARAPVEHKNDFPYPINRWTAKDGINYKKLEDIFHIKMN